MSGYIVLISVTGYILALIALHEIFRRFPVFATALFCLALFSLPFWLDGLHGWFRVAKTVSVLVPIVILNILRLANHPSTKMKVPAFFRKPWGVWVMYVVLFVNVLEAVIKGFSSGYYANAVAGALIGAMIPLPPKHWRFEGAKSDLIVDLPAVWAILYSTWNLTFVLGEYPVYVFHVFAILFAALSYPVLFKRPDLYASCRAYTLGVSIFLRGTFDFVTPLMDSSDLVKYQWLGRYFGVINLVAVSIYVAYLILRKTGISKNRDEIGGYCVRGARQ